MKWSRLFDRCQRCGTTENKHKSLGNCTVCYQQTYRARRAGTRWSMNYAKCQCCGTVSEPHRAKGLCRNCYKRARYDPAHRRSRYLKVAPMAKQRPVVDDWPDDPITFKAGDRVMHKGYPGLVRGENGRGDIVIVLDGAVWHVPAGEVVRA